ncbi:MAG: hypothetical protein ACOCYN_03135 [Planctomycetota bacterium]
MAGSPLHDLKLNCLLVPAVLLLLAAAAMTWVDWSRAQQARTAAREHAAGMAALLAAGMDALPERLGPELIRRHEPGIAGVALLVPDEQAGARPLRHIGTPPSFDPEGPPPELINAWTTPRGWVDADGRLHGAAAIRDADGAALGLLHLAFVQSAPARLDPAGLRAPLGLLVLTGSLLGWYLARRIYAPVEALSAQAEAALDGRDLAGFAGSQETGRLASAIDALASAYRSSTSSRADAGPGPGAGASGPAGPA